MLIGPNPPPLVRHEKIEAAHLRTWQFLLPLLDDGHSILLCSDKVPAESLMPDGWGDQLEWRSIRFASLGWRRKLQEAHDRFEPECIFAINYSHCRYATKLRTQAPIWMDIFGDQLTIMQAASYRRNSDRGIGSTIDFMRSILKSGDMFSVCGQPQQHMLVGELAITGRLNSATFGSDLVRVVLPGSPPSPFNEFRQLDEKAAFQGNGDQKDEFRVLWCGGYNAWTDVDALFQGLEQAMAANSKIRFVSVGAGTYQARDNVYDRFISKIEQSSFRNRFEILGWQPWSTIAGHFRESDLGICWDGHHYETTYGTRTRLAEMIGHGLPVITSLGSELSYLLRDRGAALAVESGDWQGMAQQMVHLADNRDDRDRLAENAWKCAEQDLSFHTTTSSARIWANHPHSAPDKVSLTWRGRLKSLEFESRRQVRQVLWKVLDLDR